MSFSFYKIIISNDKIEKDEKRGDDRINEKGVDFEKSCDFEMIFIKACNLEACNSSSSLNKSRSLKNSRRVNDLNS